MSSNVIETAIIFAAGFGKRLQPLTLTTAKPLIPINDAGHGCIDYHINALLQAGIKKIYINTHHLSDQFKYLVKRYADCVQLVHERDVLETGGAVKNILQQFSIKEKFILALNGDVWFESYDFLEDLRNATKNTLLITNPGLAIPKKNRFDYLLLNKNKLIHHLNNHNQAAGKPGIFSGAQTIDLNKFQKFLSANHERIFSLKAYFDWLEHNQSLYGQYYQHEWCDIGTLEALHALKKKMKF